MKTMWPPGVAEPAGVRKDGCGWMLRTRFMREAVDLCRRPGICTSWVNGEQELLLVGARQHWTAGLLSRRTSIVIFS